MKLIGLEVGYPHLSLQEATVAALDLFLLVARIPSEALTRIYDWVIWIARSVLKSGEIRT